MSEVEDAGAGIGSPGGSRGLGLSSMRERAALVNGRLDLLPVGGGGTLVRLTVPLHTEEAHAEE